MKANCQACISFHAGIKNIKALTHTCGLPEGAVPDYNDTTVLDFGAFSGKSLANIPAYYLLWLLDEKKVEYRPGLKKYIQANETGLREEKKRADAKRK